MSVYVATECSKFNQEIGEIGFLKWRMAFKGLISGVLLRAVILGFGQLIGTVPTRHVPVVTEIGKAHGSGMAMSMQAPESQEGGAVQGTFQGS